MSPCAVESSFTTDAFARPARETGAYGDTRKGLELLAIYRLALFLEGSARCLNSSLSPCLATTAVRRG